MAPVARSASCAECGSQDAPYTCSRCRDTRFCSSDCQRIAWPKHKLVCVRPAPGGTAESSKAGAVLVQRDGGDEWLSLVNWDTFPGQDVGKIGSQDGIEEAKRQCLRLGLGGFVTWRGVSYLRGRPALELHANACHAQGSTLWLHAATLAAAFGAAHPGGFALPADLPEARPPPGARPVEKLSDATEEEMTERFRQSRPFVLTDAQAGWPAESKWTFDFFAEGHGDEMLHCSDLAPFFKTHDNGKMQTVSVSMREYVRYIKGEPNALRAMQKKPDRVFYGNSWAPFFTNDALLQDVSDKLYCIEDTIPREEGDFKQFNRSLTKVFLGPAGTVSRLHSDTYATHVWLSQVRGRKQFIVFPPEDSKHLHCHVEDECDGRTTLFDPSDPDYGEFPEARHARAYSVVVEEGETVVLPARWWHWAKSLTPSITLMRNFVNSVNMREHFEIRRAADEVKVQRQMKQSSEAAPPPSLRPGGVRVEVLRPGDGKSYPRKGQTLRMHYLGTLASGGRKFDSSYDRGRPLEFKIGVRQVIQGWDEGVMQMSLGEKSRLFIRSDYGYGPRGAGDAIPPDADLIFEVELLSIE